MEIDMKEVISIDAFFNSNFGPNPSCDPWKIVGEADIIVAVDYMTGTVYRAYRVKNTSNPLLGKSRRNGARGNVEDGTTGQERPRGRVAG